LLGDVVFTAAPDPPRVFDPQVLEAGYQVEMVVPGGPNTPSDVAVLPDGSLHLAAVRSSNVFWVSMSGTLTTAASVGVCALEAGPDGNLYGYFYPGAPGTVHRITPQGQVTSVGYVPWTGCESAMAVAPNLDLWIGYNGCGGTGMVDGRLYRLTQAAELFTITLDLPFGIMRANLRMQWKARAHPQRRHQRLRWPSYCAGRKLNSKTSTPFTATLSLR